MTEGNRPTRIGDFMPDTAASPAAPHSTAVADLARSCGAMNAIAKLNQTAWTSALDAIRSAGALGDLCRVSGLIGAVREAGASAAKEVSVGSAMKQITELTAWQGRAAEEARLAVERAVAETPDCDHLAAIRPEPIDFEGPPMPVNPVPGQTLDELRAVRLAMEAQVTETKAARAAQQRAEERTRAVQEASDRRDRRRHWVNLTIAAVSVGATVVVGVLFGG